MKIITGGRQSGKMARLIHLSAKEDSRIVCPSNKHADLIIKLAKDMELDIPPPITLQELAGGNPGVLLVYLPEVPIIVSNETQRTGGKRDDIVEANLSLV